MRRGAIVAAVLLATACGQEASFSKLADPEPPAEDSGSPPPEPEVDTGDPPLPECPVTEGVSATSVDKDITCKAEPDLRTMQVQTEWKVAHTHWDTNPYGSSQPVVGHLTDDNGDGVIGGAGDTPDLVAMFYASEGSYCPFDVRTGMVRLMSGAGDGAGGPLVHWELGDLDAYDNQLQIDGLVHPAIGDVDGDGEPEILVGGWYGPDNDISRVVALSHTGEVEWLSTIARDLRASGLAASTPTISLYDLDQDGNPEVYAFGRIFDGATGEQKWTHIQDRSGTMVVMDLEGDGQQELITLDGIWEQDQTERCRFDFSAVHLAVADLDDDTIGDVLVTRSGGGMAWLDRSCRLQEYWLGAFGRPVVSDHNGDGKPDIGAKSLIAGIEHYAVYKPDSTEVWSIPLSLRYAGGAGVVFDFDNDGYGELVLGVREPSVYSGVDGTRRLTPRRDSGGSSACGDDAAPLPIDIDGDRQVELLTHSNTQTMVVGDLYETWPEGPTVWNQLTHHRNHVTDSLAIPSYVGGNWPNYNDFNSVSTTPGLGQGAGLIDAAIELVNLCEVECDRDVVQITLRMTNGGLRDAFEGFDMAVYAEDDAGERTRIEQRTWPEMVRAGFTTGGITFRLDRADLPDGRVVFAADDTGAGEGRIAECDEDNNTLVLEELCQ